MPRINIESISKTDLLNDKFSVLEGVDVDDHPLFSIGETTKSFFGQESHWLRYHEKQGQLRSGRKTVGSRRSESDARRYSLRDVELVAKALARNEAITLDQLVVTLKIVRAVAEAWGFYTCAWCEEVAGFGQRSDWERMRDGSLFHLECLIAQEQAIEDALKEGDA